jgi:ribosome-associated protein
LAIEAARIAEDDKTEDIVVLDLRGVSPVTSYFVLGTGSSDRQMRTVADDIAEYGRKVDQPVWHVAGQQSGDWIVMDFVDVVVHLFDPSHRRYYDLELIWGDAPRVRWRRPRRRKAKPTK